MSTSKKYLGRSELGRIGKWKAFMKARRHWTETDEEILQIILGLNDKQKVAMVSKICQQMRKAKSGN